MLDAEGFESTFAVANVYCKLSYGGGKNDEGGKESLHSATMEIATAKVLEKCLQLSGGCLYSLIARRWSFPPLAGRL